MINYIMRFNNPWVITQYWEGRFNSTYNACIYNHIIVNADYFHEIITKLSWNRLEDLFERNLAKNRIDENCYKFVKKY